MPLKIPSLLVHLALLFTTFALPHDKRQNDNKTDSLTAGRGTADKLIASRLTILQKDLDSDFTLRSVQIRPSDGQSTSNAASFKKLTIQLYNPKDEKFYVTENFQPTLKEWSNLTESDDPTWGDSQAWVWDEKKLGMQELMNILSAAKPDWKFEEIWLERPDFDWDDSAQLWWMCVPPAPETIFWVGDFTHQIYPDEMIPDNIVASTTHKPSEGHLQLDGVHAATRNVTAVY